MARTDPVSTSAQPRRLVIVAAHQNELYEAIKHALNGDDGVEVVVDRRVGKRAPVVAMPNRAVDPRETERVQEELLQRGWAVAPRRARVHRCPRCLSSPVEPMKPGPFGGLVLRALGLRRYRCPPCRHRFFGRPLRPPSLSPR